MVLLMSTLLNFLSVLVALVAVIFVCFKWRFQYWKKRNVPHLEPTIPFGNIGNPFAQPMADKLMETYKIAKSRGWKYCGMYVMLSPVLLLVDQDMIKQVLTRDFQYFNDRGIFTNEKVDPVGCHLFALSGSKWRNLRAKLSPAFTSGKLKVMFQTLVDCGLVLEKYVENNIKPEQPVDIRKILSCYSIDVIGSCSFGLDCNSFKEPDSLFRRVGNDISNVTKPRALLMMFAQNHPRIARWLRVHQVPLDAAKYITNIVEETVAYREKNNLVRKDFMQLLMDIRNTKVEKKEGGNVLDDDKSLTMEEIVAQCFVFFIAGYETTSGSMTFALFELAMHPDIQDRLRDEITDVLAKHDDKLTYDSLNDMKYLEQVVDETMRVRPPVRIIQRVCTSEYRVPGEDLIIEKGTRLFISLPGVHLDEEYWENPEVFNPERFSEEKKKNVKQYTHLPFGHGPKMCIGERFGMMEVKVGLACILRKFKVKLNQKTKLPLKISTKTFFASAEGGIWLNLEKL